MKRVCLLLLISINVMGISQAQDSLNKKGLHPKLIPNASTAQKVAAYKDSLTIDTSYPKENEPQIRDNIPGNYDAIIQLQKERRAKQKRNAYIRIGIGIAFLIVLVIGLTRNVRSK